MKQELPEVIAVDEKGVARQFRPVIDYAYDALGRAIAMTDANRHTVAKVLDPEGRITQEIDALGYHRDKTYNLLGLLTTATNERGGVTTYTYDKANRLLSVTTAKTTQSYAYDGAGQLIAQTGSSAAPGTTAPGYPSALNEIAQAARLQIVVEEKLIPVRDDVPAACEMLGLDPLLVACEGRFAAFVAPRDAARALAILQRSQAGAARIGEVAAEMPAVVALQTALGPSRILEMPSGEQLPRIC